jgi:hypothetical protein
MPFSQRYFALVDGAVFYAPVARDYLREGYARARDMWRVPRRARRARRPEVARQTPTTLKPRSTPQAHFAQHSQGAF